MLQNINSLLTQYSPATIVEQLSPYLTPTRIERIQTILDKRLCSLEVAVESPSDIHNALAIVRTAEALGVYQIHLIAVEGKAQAIRQITQGACYWVNIQFHACWSHFLEQKRQEKCLLAGAVVSPQTSQPLETLPLHQPLCLVFGNEKRGLSEQATADCDYLYHIPLFGMTESFNLSVAAGISLHALTQKKRQLLQNPGDLDIQQKTALFAQYAIQTLEPRLVQGLLKKIVA